MYKSESRGPGAYRFAAACLKASFRHTRAGPQRCTSRGLAAIVYLAVFGSLIGFYSYFHVLSRLPAATVALITLITPVLALALGAWLNNEQLSLRVWVGAAVILLALAGYLTGDRRIRRAVVKHAD